MNTKKTKSRMNMNSKQIAEFTSKQIDEFTTAILEVAGKEIAKTMLELGLDVDVIVGVYQDLDNGDNNSQVVSNIKRGEVPRVLRAIADTYENHPEWTVKLEGE